VGYSDVCRTLEENLDTEVVARFNEQIQQFVDTALKSVGAERERVVLATTGDGAIVAFVNPTEAHIFAAALLKATEKHNSNRTTPSSQRWFRIGMATGDLYQQSRDGERDAIAGTVIAKAVRLEVAALPGQIVADITTFVCLPREIQALYGPEEIVLGKREERFPARRCTIVPYGATQDSSATVQSVLDLFDRLNPRDQLDRLMLLIGMPAAHRPPDTLELFRRQDKIVDWSSNAHQE
jgi:hypothetical protein